MQAKKKKIIIVGAGISGLAASSGYLVLVRQKKTEVVGMVVNKILKVFAALTFVNTPVAIFIFTGINGNIIGCTVFCAEFLFTLF